MLADVAERKERIRTEARRGGPRRPAGGILEDEALLDQVTNLVECPPRCSAASSSATWTSRPRCWSRR